VFKKRYFFDSMACENIKLKMYWARMYRGQKAPDKRRKQKVKQ